MLWGDFIDLPGLHIMVPHNMEEASFFHPLLGFLAELIFGHLYKQFPVQTFSSQLLLPFCLTKWVWKNVLLIFFQDKYSNSAFHWDFENKRMKATQNYKSFARIFMPTPLLWWNRRIVVQFRLKMKLSICKEMCALPVPSVMRVMENPNWTSAETKSRFLQWKQVTAGRWGKATHLNCIFTDTLELNTLHTTSVLWM